MNHSLAWQNDDRELAALVLRCLDLTELGESCSADDVVSLCRRAQGEVPHRPDVRVPAAAAVCVWPRFVAEARRQLPPAVRVAAVANFPSGQEPLAQVLHTIASIADDGGQEVDVVLPYRAWLAGDRGHMRDWLRAVRRASEGLGLKLILESGAFPDVPDGMHALQTACHLALDEGVDWLKTSTGKIARGATLEAARVLLRSIAHHPTMRNRAGCKPSGGLRRVADVRPYVQAAHELLGPSALTPQRWRIGASALWQDAVAQLVDTAPNTPPSSVDPAY
ncbi:deoxyribose-phosphate aldolase [Tepidimonas taiwanensis]|uniref:Deoxyribose-phosphate aldolase n=1 Tax=Tepidimonas taiwanensis TaxID=307486 RepID=A0A554X348_9BURK|nr:deoxyribose-phosphate aldolase [Tepidimonas taiwanensis]MCX7693637.1 deoxyribose-phosphate aldolase [Tepidimonas taiwanensis]MDM7462789.1 deoxyribose-phosphate aldolase [Tepidimonas taiwanensis]TSE30271.1 Deoxyribose-phosphate aldolase [Tepidimonas taiwanensis]UBQ04794.1 deoxyribose-phosphate aldolase [Tepidimonas taiwanensis]